jgi:hypothetical protein
MSGIYGEDRLLQLLPCVAGRHDHERHLREGEGDGVVVWWEDGQAAGPHTGLLQPSRLAAALTQRRCAHARQQRHLLRCGRRRMEAATVRTEAATRTEARMEVAMVRTEADGGGDPDGGDDPDGGGDPDGRADGDRGSDTDGGVDEGGDGDGGGDLDGDASMEGGRRDTRPVDWTGPWSHRRPSSPPPTPTASYGSPPPVVMNRERMR